MRREPGSTEESLAGDLVVDALGRGGRTPAWLEALGYARPDEDAPRVDVGYATVPVRLPASAVGIERTVGVGPVAGRPRGMILVEVENGTRMLTVMGLGAEHRPPSDPLALLDFVADFAPDVSDGAPLGGAAGRQSPPIATRHTCGGATRRCTGSPMGSLVVGDALCSFSPIYAQGMTVAAQEAIALPGLPDSRNPETGTGASSGRRPGSSPTLASRGERRPGASRRWTEIARSRCGCSIGTSTAYSPQRRATTSWPDSSCGSPACSIPPRPCSRRHRGTSAGRAAGPRRTGRARPANHSQQAPAPINQNEERHDDIDRHPGRGGPDRGRRGTGRRQGVRPRDAAVTALDGVTSAFPAGRLTAIMGPSGSGQVDPAALPVRARHA